MEKTLFEVTETLKSEKQHAQTQLKRINEV